MNLLPGLVADVTVHTTGVNWQGVAAVATAVVLLLSPIFGATIFVLRAFITSAIDRALVPIVERLNSLDTRVARLEGMEAGRRVTIDQQIVTNPPHGNSQ